MVITFGFKTAGTQWVCTDMRIVLKLALIQMTKFKMQTSKMFQTYWINTLQPLSKLMISFMNFKNESTVLISGLSLFHS